MPRRMPKSSRKRGVNPVKGRCNHRVITKSQERYNDIGEFESRCCSDRDFSMHIFITRILRIPFFYAFSKQILLVEMIFSVFCFLVVEFIISFEP